MESVAISGAFAYLDEQIEALRMHVRPAFGEFDKTAVHQARVATRRLKAGFDVLSPLLHDLRANDVAKAGKLLRRRLGPLRDLDVMIDHLDAGGLPPRLADAVGWVRRHFESARTDARADNAAGPKKITKWTAKFDDWWRIRHGLEPTTDAVGPLLTAALHGRFDAFAALADRVAGVAESPADAPPIDIHELRIDGKAVRYAFELAAAHGLPVKKKIAKTFKSMQDALGTWHDEVVLAERILRAAVDAELPLHQPALASAVLDMARNYLQRSERSLGQFKSQWKRSGASLRRSLNESVPLIVEPAASVIESPTPAADAPPVPSINDADTV